MNYKFGKTCIEIIYAIICIEINGLLSKQKTTKVWLLSINNSLFVNPCFNLILWFYTLLTFLNLLTIVIIPFSAFVAKLVPREEILLENINISPKSKGVESMNLSESDSDVEADHEIPAMEMNYGGTTNYRNVNFFSFFATLLSIDTHLRGQFVDAASSYIGAYLLSLGYPHKIY